MNGIFVPPVVVQTNDTTTERALQHYFGIDLLVQGDLNHRPEDPEYGLWVKAGLIDIGKAKGIGDQPTAPSVRPLKRIDYIWSTPELAKKAQRAAVLDKPPFVPEPADPSSYALSDHLPVMAEFLMQA